MSPEKQRIAVAETQGWTNVHRSQKTSVSLFDKLIGQHPSESIHVPDYLSDLNAMWEVEGTLNAGLRVDFEAELMRILDVSSLIEVGEGFMLAHATAAQRAEAFLRTAGKWEDEA